MPQSSRTTSRLLSSLLKLNSLIRLHSGVSTSFSWFMVSYERWSLGLPGGCDSGPSSLVPGPMLKTYASKSLP